MTFQTSSYTNSLLFQYVKKAIADLNPLIKLIELPNAGHCPHDEYPEQFNALLLDWLDLHKSEFKKQSSTSDNEY